MKRTLYLEGELGEKYGREFEVSVNTYNEAFRLLEANFPSFRKDVIEMAEDGIGFIFETEGEYIEEPFDLLVPVKEGDMTVTPIPAGSSGGAGKILAGVAMIGMLFIPGGAAILSSTFAGTGFSIAGAAGAGAATFGGISAAASAGALGFATTMGVYSLGLGLGASLILNGIQQIMSPDPETDSGAPDSYQFNGQEQSIVDGDPVPVLYGELRVPGRPIQFGVLNGSTKNDSYTTQFGTSTYIEGIGVIRSPAARTVEA